jgi:hypothetical protein
MPFIALLYFNVYQFSCHGSVSHKRAFTGFVMGFDPGYCQLFLQGENSFFGVFAKIFHPDCGKKPNTCPGGGLLRRVCTGTSIALSYGKNPYRQNPGAAHGGAGGNKVKSPVRGTETGDHKRILRNKKETDDGQKD